MNVLLVTAHDDPKFFVAAMHNTALSVLERDGNTVVTTNLHAQQFNPAANVWDFTTSSGAHANYMFEQQRAINTGSGFSPDITTEMDKVVNAELIIFNFPLWWGAPPAILKGWFDRVLAMGFAWDGDSRYTKGLMKGKKVLLTVSVGDPESFYSAEGMHRATVTQHLYPLTHRTLAFCGFSVLKPSVIHNTTAGSRESIEHELAVYRKRVETINQDTDFIYTA